MRNLLRSRRGFNADGRALGLGLAMAMDKAMAKSRDEQRREATREVEAYLREQAPVTPASV